MDQHEALVLFIEKRTLCTMHGICMQRGFKLIIVDITVFSKFRGVCQCLFALLPFNETSVFRDNILTLRRNHRDSCRHYAMFVSLLSWTQLELYILYFYCLVSLLSSYSSKWRKCAGPLLPLWSDLWSFGVSLSVHWLCWTFQHPLLLHFTCGKQLPWVFPDLCWMVGGSGWCLSEKRFKALAGHFIFFNVSEKWEKPLWSGDRGIQSSLGLKWSFGPLEVCL